MTDLIQGGRALKTAKQKNEGERPRYNLCLNILFAEWFATKRLIWSDFQPRPVTFSQFSAADVYGTIIKSCETANITCCRVTPM